MARALVSGARALVCGARALVSVARALVAGPRRAQSAGTRRAGASSTRTYGETTSPQSTAPTRTPNRDRGLNTLAFTRMTDKGERPLPRYTRSALPQALPSPPSWHTRTRAPVGETGSPGRSEPGRLTTATRGIHKRMLSSLFNIGFIVGARGATAAHHRGSTAAARSRDDHPHHFRPGRSTISERTRRSPPAAFTCHGRANEHRKAPRRYIRLGRGTTAGDPALDYVWERRFVQS